MALNPGINSQIPGLDSGAVVQGVYPGLSTLYGDKAFFSAHFKSARLYRIVAFVRCPVTADQIEYERADLH